MYSHLLIFLLSFLFQDKKEVPYKPFSEFEILIDYKFKQRPGVDRYKVDYSETREDREKNQFQGAPLPYLVVSIKLLKLSEEEVKVKAINNLGHNVFSKKAELDTPVKIDVGFTDDAKDRVTPYEFTITFLSLKKKETSRIHMFIMEDGTFVVNNEKRGKF